VSGVQKILKQVVALSPRERVELEREMFVALDIARKLMPATKPMLTGKESSEVNFTVSGESIHIQAPREIIEKIELRLLLIGAKANPKSPYGPWSARNDAAAS
jgi:hypothetical protein